MRSLLPPSSERVNLFGAYSSGVPRVDAAPFLRVNMISSLDGAIAVGGRSGGLGGPGDKLLFAVLRSLSDVVLVGAGTTKIERYGPVELPEAIQSAREERGQARLPPIAVVTQSLDLDWGSKLFAVRSPRPIVIAPGSADAAKLAHAREVAEVLTAGVGSVDLPSAVRTLAAEGMHHILCEGGPTLNTGLAAAGLVDELCLTLSPQLAGSAGGVLMGGWLGSGGSWLARTGASGERLIRSQPFTQLVKLELVHVLEEDSYLFLRLRARPEADGGPGSCK